jgi:predicted secreted hydrolase
MPRPRRRDLLAQALPLGWTLAWPLSAQAQARPAPPALGVTRRTLRFPADHGAHPDTRTEWWYATGWLVADAPGVEPAGPGVPPTLGFQVTFFRSRTGIDAAHPSAFAAQQLLFAHAAVVDLERGDFLHEQRIARTGFGRAAFDTDDTRLVLQGWRFEREGRRPPAAGVEPAGEPMPGPGSRYRARVGLGPDGRASGALAFDLQLDTTQPVLLQGEQGYSRKGPQAQHASHYYSQPHLAVRGQVWREGRPVAVHGRAWLDHEWSVALMPPEAVGWDWIGMNLFDGRALTAFRLRRADGRAVWAGGSARAAGASAASFAAEAVRFEALRHWRSPASGARYPVAWRVHTPAGVFTVQALAEAQELDSRGSTGAIYWEGLSELLDGTGRRVGLGYLEMTGYATRLRL